MKSFFKILAVILIICVLFALILGIVLWCTEYKPEATEALSYNQRGSRGLYSGREINIVEWNIKRGITSRSEDSYKEGGAMKESNGARPVYENLLGISETLNYYDADIYIIDDVDTSSKSTMNIDEAAYISDKLNLVPLFAYDKKVKYIPYPWPFEGNSNKGNMMLSHFGLSSLERRALPYKNTSFPLHLVAEKPGAMVAKIPLSNSDASLVLINATLEKAPIVTEASADSQMDALLRLAYDEYDNGKNYVIVASSFNRLLSDNATINNNAIAIPQKFNTELNEGWSLVYDENTPSTRSLNAPLKDNSSIINTYITDGYIVSPNIDVNSVETIDEEFFYSSHNPVRLKAVLK